MHISNISKGPVAPNSSMPLAFGCSNLWTRRLTLYERALDEILGFGKQDTSFISHFYSQGKAPKIFSHCLKGDISGGDILILGEVVEPNMSYTPLILKQPHCNINLESISVDGHILKIDPTVFTTLINKGAIIDSGTTMAYFIEGAYNPIVEQITRTIPRFASTIDSNGFHCNLVTTGALNVMDIFPPISLNFANNASLVLRPQDYLLLIPRLDGGKWCLTF
ncbi:PREDICTED: aspartic proteinase-like protein 2 isoform X2 [Lupinus angustifolius]|uniref:aspartic proteinase-like protein 2 isoform X2 n=1 Tax=Lupinus angustifolius TaxID=3871 RepID=UPI00092F26A5|nr:PREDICTED: aspartic proteinase-like protein 2 isoform X2 [Lupinus angustifolius]